MAQSYIGQNINANLSGADIANGMILYVNGTCMVLCKSAKDVNFAHRDIAAHRSLPETTQLMRLSNRLPLYIDISFCVLLVPALMLLLPIDRWLVSNSLFVYMLVAWLYAVYASNRFFVVPMWFEGRRKYVPLLVLGLCIAGTYLLTAYMAEGRLEHMNLLSAPRFGEINPDCPPPLPGPRRGPRMRTQRMGVWMMFVIVTTFSFVVGLLTELLRESSRRQSLEIAKQKAELALYKAQINPHFLFNSLNVLYGMVIAGSAKTEVAFTHFIAMMRYMYESNDKEWVSVDVEADYLRQYIDFQRYRLPGYAVVNYSYGHDGSGGKKLAPMILITFVENVFKHGVSSSEPTESSVALRVREGVLVLETSNAYLPDETDRNQGIGIANCRQRLMLLYPGRHRLDIDLKDGRYNVRLEITL